VVPKFACLALEGRPLPIHGTGEAMRSWLHVEDLARALMVILVRGKDAGTYNVGSPTEASVLEVAAGVAREAARHRGEGAAGVDEGDATPAGLPLVVHVADRLFNDRRYHISDARTRALGWRARVGWDEGLRATVAWYAWLMRGDRDGDDKKGVRGWCYATGHAGRGVASWWPGAGQQASLSAHPDTEPTGAATTADALWPLVEAARVGSGRRPDR